MAETRLKRKGRKNRVVSKKRVDNIKRLISKPVIKNVDIEEIKEGFSKKKTAAKAPAVKEEKPEAVQEEAPKAEEQKEAPKAKKTAKKEDSEEK